MDKNVGLLTTTCLRDTQAFLHGKLVKTYKILLNLDLDGCTTDY